MDTLTVTTQKMAEILCISRRAVRKRAEKGKWQFREGNKKAKCYLISFLPEDIKIAIAAYRQKQTFESLRVERQALVPSSPPAFYAPSLPDKGGRSLPAHYAPGGLKLDKGMAKYDLLSLYLKALAKAKHGRKSYTRTE
jgi:hypothetical protein